MVTSPVGSSPTLSSRVCSTVIVFFTNPLSIEHPDHSHRRARPPPARRSPERFWISDFGFRISEKGDVGMRGEVGMGLPKGYLPYLRLSPDLLFRNPKSEIRNPKSEFAW